MTRAEFVQLKDDLLHQDRFTGAQIAEKVSALLALGPHDQVSTNPDVAMHGETLRDRILHRWRHKPDHMGALWNEFFDACSKLVT